MNRVYVSGDSGGLLTYISVYVSVIPVHITPNGCKWGFLDSAECVLCSECNVNKGGG
jgi:hypothetical protein